jgi:predicted SAM-dependent methyltransferase
MLLYTVDKPYLECGAECNRHTHRERFDEQWFTIGRSNKTPLDLRANLDDPLPFAAEQFELVFSSHVLEHLFDARRFLAECFRVLRSGGVCRANVPNARWLMERYLAGRCGLQQCVENLRSYTPGYHRQAYDTETLGATFCEAGFVQVATSDDDDTRVDLFREPYFWTRRSRTIWAEGEKP